MNRLFGFLQLRLIRFTMSSAKDELSKRAVQADSLIAQLRLEISEVKHLLLSNFHEEEENRLLTENKLLKQQVEDWKNKLVQLEISHGIKQVDSSEINILQSSKITEPIVPKSDVATNKNEKKAAKSQEKPPKSQEKPPKQPPTQSATEIVDVSRLDLRIGRIVDVKKHPDADALYVEQIDVGEEKPRTIISGLVKHIKQEELQDRLVVVLCNLKPVKMRGIASEGMVMCASTVDKVEVLSPPPGSNVGDLVSCDGFEGKPDTQLNPKKKVFELIAPDLKTNEQFEASYKGSCLVVKEKGSIKAATLVNAPVK